MNSTHFMTEFRENDGKGQFSFLSFSPSLSKKVNDNLLIFEIQRYSRSLSILIKNGNETSTLFNDRQRIFSKKSLLAVSAQNLDSDESIVVNYIHVQSSTITEYVEPEIKNFEPDIDFSPDQTSAMDVVKFVDQVISFSSALAERNSIQNLIEETLLPFVDSWQRRSIVIVNKTRKLSDQLNVQLNETRIGLNSFKTFLDSEFKDYRADVSSFESKLFFGIMKAHTYNTQLRDIKKDATRRPAITWMIRFGILEIILIFGIFLFSKITQNRSIPGFN